MKKIDARKFKDAAYAHLAEVGKALSSATRLEILELLAQGPRTVEVLAKEVEQSVANTSHHLQTLKRANLVQSERDGLHFIYRVVGDDVGVLVAQLQEIAGRRVAALEKLSRDYFLQRDGLEAIDHDTLMARLKDDDVTLIDVRPEHEFAHAHLPGALSIPLSMLEDRLNLIPKDRAVIAYCRGPFCALSAEAAQRLRGLGYDARRTDSSVGSVNKETR